MIYKPFQDISLSRLGLDNMRLPALHPGDPKSPIDWPAAHEILKLAMESGINYYDTAYVYQGGESERCLGEGMKQFPRDSFCLATKYNVAANPDYREVFATQLERLQTDYIDFYLLHCLMDSRIDDYLNNGCIDYFLDLKVQGKIRYLGFSSHASPATLRRFADHHQWDFAQLQINYFDWNYSTTKEEYNILDERNIPIMVMEPVRGGRLAQLTPDAEKLLKDAHPDWSIASWAMRFVRTLPRVQVILSGMSTLEQVRDNAATFSDPGTLSDEDMATLMKACDLFHTQLQVPCTGCRYCCDDCPMQINIPEYLKVYNAWKIGEGGIRQDLDEVESQGKFESCIGCGSCTGHCPQNIAIPEIMAQLKEKFG